MLEKKISKIERKIEKLKQKINKKHNKIQLLKDKSNNQKIIIKKDKQKVKQEKRLKNIQLNEAPLLPVIEEIGNSISHGVGAIFAIIALILLLNKSSSPYHIVASIIYSLSIFIMMLSSCLYHAFKHKSRVKRLFRRFDYSSIYLLIGGTYAPFLLVHLGGNLGLILFIVQWVLIITGISMLCIFGPGRLKWLHYPMYFIIGWSGILFLPDWLSNHLELLLFILGGGIVYTLGMIPFAKKGTKGAHFIWHFFALFGCVVHFIGIYLYVF